MDEVIKGLLPVIYAAVEKVIDEQVDTHGEALGRHIAKAVADSDSRWDDEAVEKLERFVDAVQRGIDAGEVTPQPAA